MKKLLFFLFFFLISESYGKEGKNLSGRVLLDNSPVGKGEVIAREIDKNEIFKTETDENGYYNITLKEGVYSVEAQKRIGNILYIGFSGKNPILLKEDTYAGIKLLPPSKMTRKKLSDSKTEIVLKILYNGKPVSSARAYLYLKEKDMKGMPFFYSEPTDKSGIIKIRNIIEGSYYIVVRKKKDHKPLGPISEGDLIGFFSQNPLNIKDGYRYTIEINMFQKIQDEITSPLDIQNVKKITGIALSESGEPVSGVYAFLYTKKEMGHERPISISRKTGDDGKFELLAPFTGKFYLGVRQFYGGTPVQGELYGLYDKTHDHHINVFDNITGIIIRVKKILR
ncbi:MAG: carboxypeptidase-like regulatory domain-containing protein [Proteobacteria bacterium]|nr:carboxypeptidase-like regulatory domain-containing protein [Pseudomonadota bacterium]